MKSIDLKIGSSINYENYLVDAKNKKIHLVCIADTQPQSYCSRLYHALIESSEPENSKYENLINKVNKVKDVGSFYPAANFTIVPSYDYKNPENESRIKNDLKEIIFEANEKFMQTDTIVFLIDDNAMSYNILSKLINEIFNDFTGPLSWLRTIIFC